MFFKYVFSKNMYFLCIISILFADDISCASAATTKSEEISQPILYHKDGSAQKLVPTFFTKKLNANSYGLDNLDTLGSILGINTFSEKNPFEAIDKKDLAVSDKNFFINIVGNKQKDGTVVSAPFRQEWNLEGLSEKIGKILSSNGIDESPDEIISPIEDRQITSFFSEIKSKDRLGLAFTFFLNEKAPYPLQTALEAYQKLPLEFVTLKGFLKIFKYIYDGRLILAGEGDLGSLIPLEYMLSFDNHQFVEYAKNVNVRPAWFLDMYEDMIYFFKGDIDEDDFFTDDDSLYLFLKESNHNINLVRDFVAKLNDAIRAFSAYSFEDKMAISETEILLTISDLFLNTPEITPLIEIFISAKDILSPELFLPMLSYCSLKNEFLPNVVLEGLEDLEYMNSFFRIFGSGPKSLELVTRVLQDVSLKTKIKEIVERLNAFSIALDLENTIYKNNQSIENYSYLLKTKQRLVDQQAQMPALVPVQSVEPEEGCGITYNIPESEQGADPEICVICHDDTNPDPDHGRMCRILQGDNPIGSFVHIGCLKIWVKTSQTDPANRQSLSECLITFFEELDAREGQSDQLEDGVIESLKTILQYSLNSFLLPLEEDFVAMKESLDHDFDYFNLDKWGFFFPLLSPDEKVEYLKQKFSKASLEQRDELREFQKEVINTIKKAKDQFELQKELARFQPSVREIAEKIISAESNEQAYLASEQEIVDQRKPFLTEPDAWRSLTPEERFFLRDIQERFDKNKPPVFINLIQVFSEPDALDEDSRAGLFYTLQDLLQINPDLVLPVDRGTLQNPLSDEQQVEFVRLRKKQNLPLDYAHYCQSLPEDVLPIPQANLQAILAQETVSSVILAQNATPENRINYDLKTEAEQNLYLVYMTRLLNRLHQWKQAIPNQTARETFRQLTDEQQGTLRAFQTATQSTSSENVFEESSDDDSDDDSDDED